MFAPVQDGCVGPVVISSGYNEGLIKKDPKCNDKKGALLCATRKTSLQLSLVRPLSAPSNTAALNKKNNVAVFEVTRFWSQRPQPYWHQP